MMKKVSKILLSITSYALIATIAVVGTVAYLKSEDSDVNVMTLGNVSIVQHEYERATNEDGTYKTNTIDDQNSYVLEDFEQGKALLPIVGDPSLSGTDPAYAGWDSTIVRMTQVDSYGSMQVFAGKNAQDKFVTVENTGATDAYIRTLVAIECGEGDANLIGSSFHLTWEANEIGGIEVNGNKYQLTEYIYKGAEGVRHENGILPAGDTSYPNLSQVYLKSETTNEDCEALDGNDNGTLDILVFSQAVQAAGFDDATTALDAAFGDITTTSHPWSENAPVIPTTVSTADELTAALKAGERIVLTEDITVTEYVSLAGANIDIDGNGKTLTIDMAGATWLYTYNGGTINISDLTITGKAAYAIYNQGGNVTMDNVTVDGMDGNYVLCMYGGGDVVMNNCNVSGQHAGKATIWFGDGRHVTINGGTYSSMLINASRGAGQPSTGTLILNNATVGKVRVGATTDANGNVVRANLINNGSTIAEIDYEK